LFWGLCEFGVLEEDIPDWFSLASGESVQVVGKDAGGGRFCLCPSSRDFKGRLLYVDSEGQAGVIARTLAEGIRMTVALPYWRDCLKFSGSGSLSEMGKAQARAEARLERVQPDVAAKRAEMLNAFKLAPLADPLEALHTAIVEGADTRVIATYDGSHYASLFNSFVV
jgi:hypothetical protein